MIGHSIFEGSKMIMNKNYTNRNCRYNFVRTHKHTNIKIINWNLLVEYDKVGSVYIISQRKFSLYEIVKCWVTRRIMNEGSN
jgi:hypothetical protein